MILEMRGQLASNCNTIQIETTVSRPADACELLSRIWGLSFRVVDRKLGDTVDEVLWFEVESGTMNRYYCRFV